MRPLRVTAVLADGRVATVDGFLPLDSILAAAWMRLNRPDLYYGQDCGRLPADELFHPPLPLERRTENGEWFWACSFAQYTPVGEGIDHWHKRFDAQYERYVDFQGRRGRVADKSGPYKSYRMPLVYMVAPTLTWYAVGDGAAVESLLAGIAGIGKKVGIGYGQVARWTVEDWGEDLSCRDRRGRPMRTLPTKDGPFYGGIRPPYWHPANQVMCARPEAGGWNE